MASISGLLATGSPWRRRMVALAAGAVGALALAPLGFLPAMFIAMTVSVWLIDAEACQTDTPSRARAAATTGWWFGFGYFVAGLWWLGAAFLVEAEQFAWAMPLGVLGLPAVLAIFTGAGFGLAATLWSQSPFRVLLLAGSLGLSEYLRGVVLTGFPWNAFGMAFAEHLALSQIASVVGLYGLTVLTVAICAAPATLTDPSAKLSRKAISGGNTRRHGATAQRLMPCFAALLALAAMQLYGYFRVPTDAAATVDGVRIRIVQPAITQDTNVFNWDNREKILNNYISLSEGDTPAHSLKAARITHVVWPESAFPFLLASSPEARSAIGKMLPEGAVLITGAARGEATAPGGRPAMFFNSMQVVDHNGDISGVYDKSHLVPFGEYMPFTKILDIFGVRQFVNIPGGFSAGRPAGDLGVPGLPHVTPLICYEAIFPGFGAARHDSGLIINVTNDGWFGSTPGPWQHFSQARLRAIEQGLPLVRVANTGISAVVDSWGRTNTFITLGEIGYADSALPVAVPPTVYSQMGNTNFAMLLVFCFGIALAARRRDSRTGIR